jgi:hypothetical protein
MPLEPDVVTEFAVGPACPPAALLDRLSEQLADLFMPSLETAPQPRSMAVCQPRTTPGTNVASLGLWTDTNGFSDSQLRTALASANLLVPGRTLALLVTTRAIQLRAAAAWAVLNKKIGRTTLKTLDVDVRPNQIVTKVTGTYDPPFLVIPDIDFTVHVFDKLSLRTLGSIPPLQTETSTDVEPDIPDVLKVSFLVGLLSPILGAITFFAADPIAESQAPEAPGAGGTLAAQWPAEILTEIRPPFLPGKFTFTWRDLTVDERGVRTLGTFTGASRRPRVSIVGPQSVKMREATGEGRAIYGIRPHDLRADPDDEEAPLTVQWGGVAQGTGMTKTVSFFSPGQSQVSVNVRDEDGLSARNEIAVTVTVIPLEPGQQPF